MHGFAKSWFSLGHRKASAPGTRAHHLNVDPSDDVPGNPRDLGTFSLANRPKLCDICRGLYDRLPVTAGR